jgi:hypothetical protein
MQECYRHHYRSTSLFQHYTVEIREEQGIILFGADRRPWDKSTYAWAPPPPKGGRARVPKHTHTPVQTLPWA